MCRTVQAALDYKADAELTAFCNMDADRICADVTPGDGRVQQCLVCALGAGGLISPFMDCHPVPRWLCRVHWSSP